ncbi:8-oxo-dGTP diphosphatase [Alteribacillus persepolensis]|uniref:8-oxo-dGTP diphosphatase n=1 Tax=Alteribacillus persepolensis TaxID=568899 RepID=A0A1G8AJK8_9BACI|nr:8-oxo-dGTP diphosphatase [Alteribacillus persepolensis]SDH21079.1 8-oxo-dGTP diphosphatase [Alteribacillus persepolensis]
MQRVTNCVLMDKHQVLMLQKPSRHWWVAPGGKMEAEESVLDSVTREFWEETGVTVKNPMIRGIFTFLIIEKEKTLSEWMMFTFAATAFEGALLDSSPEGMLAWQPQEKVLTLPMAEGDRHILRHILENQGILYGTFRYTSDYQLISSNLQTSGSEGI